MNKHLRYLEQQALNERLTEWTTGHTVFGTLKFASGYLTPEDKADKIHRLFWQKVDRTYFSASAVKNSNRINRVCFKHFGYSGENIHYHFTAKISDIVNFSKVAHALWQTVDRHTGTIAIEAIKDIKNARHYLAHEYINLGSKTLDETTTHWTSKYEPENYKSLSQMRRILKAQDKRKEFSL
jgi:hypothetical protein